MIGNFDTIKEEFEDIISYSQAYPFDINASSLLKKWEKVKAPFIRAFGRKTLIRSEKPIKIKLSMEARARKFKTFLSYIDDIPGFDFDSEFYGFLKDNEEGFFENKVVTPYVKKNIQSGAKLVKSFRKFGNNERTIRKIQDMASRFIQEDKIEGYLYLSVDPRDFLTLSENNESWTSCHSLDGEYRAGNLSYMTDTTTIIAYVANEKKEQLKCMPKGIEWYSKKWRMLVHINLGRVVYFNKQYPFSHDNLQDMVHEMLVDTFPTLGCMTGPSSVGFKTISYKGHVMDLAENVMYLLSDRVYNSRDVIDYSDYLGYGDLVTSPSYTPIASMNVQLYSDNASDEDNWFHNIMDIKIGGRVPCVCCGDENVSRTNRFICDMCIADKDADEDFYCFCSSCGKHIYDDDAAIENDGELYCEKCYNEIKRLEEDDEDA